VALYLLHGSPASAIAIFTSITPAEPPLRCPEIPYL
jgi:hypothetical protein